MGKAGVADQLIRRGPAVENSCRQRDQIGGRAARVGFELAERRHWLVMEVEPPRGNERIEPRQWQLMARDGRAQRGRYRMRLDLAAIHPVKHVAPPLQPDLASQGI